MASDAQSLHKLKCYTSSLQNNGYANGSSSMDHGYGSRIERTMQSLQNQVKQNEAAIENLRTSTPPISWDSPSPIPIERLAQLRGLQAAYNSLTLKEPNLPLPSSPLPALLALRNTLNDVDRTKKLVGKTVESIDESRARLRRMEKDSRNARILTKLLEDRVAGLRTKAKDLSEQSSEQSTQAKIQTQNEKEKHYTTEQRNLVKMLNAFIDEHLAIMIAAEDLGGPVVGDAKINAKMLDPTSKRCRKIKSEFRSLIEKLLNAAATAIGVEEDSHIRIQRNSAGVQFLVRAKVACFDPDDARKLRLVDLGERFAENMDD